MKQNRLLFLAADADQVSHLKETVRALLAWRSIETDLKETRITLDNIQAKQVSQNREQTRDTVLRLVRDTYKWLVAPTQAVSRKDGSVGEIEWEAQALNPNPDPDPNPNPNPVPPQVGPTATMPTHFWASAELDSVGASLKFANIMKELVELFSARHGTKVVIKVDIEASDSRGFDETTVRAAKENSRVLGISSADFE